VTQDTIWLFMVRVSFIKRIDFIDIYPTANRLCQEPWFTIPVAAFAENFKKLRHDLYHYRPYGIGAGNRMRNDKAHAKSFLAKHYEDCLAVIDKYSLASDLKTFAEYGYYNRLYAADVISPEKRDEHYLSIAKRVGFYSEILRGASLNELPLFMLNIKKSVSLEFINSVKGRLIYYGVLGKNFSKLYDLFCEAGLKADIYIDNGALVNIKKHGFKVIHAADYTPVYGDTIVIFPIKKEVISEICETYTNSQQCISVCSAEDIIKLRYFENDKPKSQHGDNLL
jgi:hypothetical protein